MLFNKNEEKKAHALSNDGGILHDFTYTTDIMLEVTARTDV